MSFRHAQRDERVPAGACKSSQPMSVSKLVESLGFGPAQVRVIALSSFSVYFCDGTELSVLPVLSTSIGAAFALGPLEEARMLSIAFFGMMIGNVCAGYIGDTLGRRPAILLSLGTTAAMGYLSAIVTDYPSLMLARCLLGMGMGIGMGPSMVRVSENCPESHRVLCQGWRSMSSGCFSSVVVNALVAFDDPHLQDLNWRRIMVVVAIFPTFCFIAAFFLLGESPVWLASVGAHREAQAGFADVREQNAAYGIDLDYEPPTMSKHEQLGVWEQLRIIFSRRTAFMTCSLMTMCFLVNVATYGDSYALAHILPDISTLPAAWQMMLRSFLSGLWIILGVVLVGSMSRKHATLLSLLSLSVGAFSFAVGGAAAQPRSMVTEALFQSATNMVSFATSMLFVAVFQYAVEIYPPSVASTGSAVVIATGRLGAVAAPMVFEWVRYAFSWWGAFYVCLGSFAFAVAAVFSVVPDVEPFRPGETDLGILCEIKGLEDGTKAATYGAAGEALAAVGVGSSALAK